jgi:cobalt-zinc-cadmium efflux system protein
MGFNKAASIKLQGDDKDKGRFTGLSLGSTFTMSHSHQHQHASAPTGGQNSGHLHNHGPVSYGTRFLVGIALNLTLVIIEAVFGILANSVSLIADAGHNLSDVLGLGVAFVATALARRAPSPRFTYGLKATSILAALFNGVFLLVATGGLSYAAIERLFRPQPIATTTVMTVAAIGVVINAFTAALFASGRKHDLNIRGAFLHMAADAAISAGVVIAALVILYTGQLWLDPLMSLIIAAIIILGTWDLLRESLAMSLGAVPVGIATPEVRQFLTALPGVAALHDLHIWSMSTSETALTGHLVMPNGHPGDSFLMEAAVQLHERYRIGHVTLQVETGLDTICALAPDEVV